jgi:predicted transcriptional regulator
MPLAATHLRQTCRTCNDTEAVKRAFGPVERKILDKIDFGEELKLR